MTRDYASDRESNEVRVIKEIPSVEPDCDAPRFADPDLLLQIRVDIPTTRSIERI
jgi:hypothetical protein